MPADALAEVRAWCAKANDDLVAARLIARGGGPTTVGCYLCQQAIEELLKALLLHAGTDAPRTHDLADLVRRLGPAGVALGLPPGDLRAWTAYAIASRYPGFPDEQSDADLPAMLDAATALAGLIDAIIGPAPTG